jgi:hypothetical protein
MYLINYRIRKRFDEKSWELLQPYWTKPPSTIIRTTAIAIHTNIIQTCSSNGHTECTITCNKSHNSDAVIMRDNHNHDTSVPVSYGSSVVSQKDKLTSRARETRPVDLAARLGETTNVVNTRMHDGPLWSAPSDQHSTGTRLARQRQCIPEGNPFSLHVKRLSSGLMFWAHRRGGKVQASGMWPGAHGEWSWSLQMLG